MIGNVDRPDLRVQGYLIRGSRSSPYTLVRPADRSGPWIDPIRFALTLSLCGEDAGAEQPDLVARRRRLVVRALAELASSLVVAELEVAPAHLVVEPRALQRRLRHRQSHVPAAPPTQHVIRTPMGL